MTKSLKKKSNIDAELRDTSIASRDTQTDTQYHVPVLLQASIDGLNIHPNGIYVDATFGGGGHSKAILNQLDKGKLLAFDRDADAQNNIPEHKNLIFIRNNFRFLRNYLRLHNIDGVDGILADLGVSSHHFDEGERGFSFRFTEANLDMRMNRDATLTAAHVINTYPMESLRKIFTLYGEIDHAHKLAQGIEQARQSQEIQSVQDLIDAIHHLIPRMDENKYLAKLFQALRIEVNGEMTALDHFLSQCATALLPKGRLAVISYHSLEDRLVKNLMKTGNTEGVSEKDFYGKLITPYQMISRKAILPSAEEMAINTRARSAKLRIAERVANKEE